MRHAASHVVDYLRRRAAAGASLADVADEIEAGALARERGAREADAVPVVRRPTMIGNLPESEQARAIEADRRKSERHKAAGTLPTPVPRGAQR